MAIHSSFLLAAFLLAVFLRLVLVRAVLAAARLCAPADCESRKGAAAAFNPREEKKLNAENIEEEAPESAETCAFLFWAACHPYCCRLRVGFCPLCKAEYRDGFTQCSDCHTPLVSTYEEADAIGVGSLWTGDNRKRMDRILDSLTEAGISFHSKELFKPSVWPRVSILIWRFMRPRPTFEFHVDVFQKDLTRPKEMVGAIEKAESVDFEDEE